MRNSPTHFPLFFPRLLGAKNSFSTFVYLFYAPSRSQKSKSAGKVDLLSSLFEYIAAARRRPELGPMAWRYKRVAMFNKAPLHFSAFPSRHEKAPSILCLKLHTHIPRLPGCSFHNRFKPVFILLFLPHAHPSDYGALYLSLVPLSSCPRASRLVITRIRRHIA